MKKAGIKFLVSLAAIVTAQTFCCAAVKQEMSDGYLMGQFDWALYLDVRDMPSYLNYQGSKLNPLTRVRVYFRNYARQADGNKAGSIKLYEDIWYHKGQVIGLRRQMPLTLENNQSGCIMTGAFQNQNQTLSEKSATDAIVRLLADLYLKNGVASAVFVPNAQYETISNNLSHYRFSPQMNTSEGVQISLHLQAYPNGNDEYFYLSK